MDDWGLSRVVIVEDLLIRVDKVDAITVPCFRIYQIVVKSLGVILSFCVPVFAKIDLGMMCVNDPFYIYTA